MMKNMRKKHETKFLNEKAVLDHIPMLRNKKQFQSCSVNGEKLLKFNNKDSWNQILFINDGCCLTGAKCVNDSTACQRSGFDCILSENFHENLKFHDLKTLNDSEQWLRKYRIHKSYVENA
jgi:hypothetical protein